MERQINEIGDVVVVRTRGTIRSTEFITDREEMIGWIGDGHRKFVFNVAGLSHIGSSSLGILLQCHKIAHGSGAALKVVVTDAQMALLRITKLDEVFDAYVNEGAALAGFLPGSSEPGVSV